MAEGSKGLNSGDIKITTTLLRVDGKTLERCEKNEDSKSKTERPFVCTNEKGRENDSSISMMENGQYKVRYAGIELPFTVATPENANNVLVMTEQALVQYESCKTQHELLSSIQKQFIDCTFSAKETVFSGMEIPLNDSMIPFSDTSTIHEEQFRKALERLAKKNGEKVWIETDADMYSFLSKFSNFLNTITSSTNPLSQ